MLRCGRALACSLIRSTNAYVVASRSAKPTAACLGGYLTTLQPNTSSSLLQLPRLQPAWHHRYHDKTDKAGQQPQAAATGSVPPPAPAAARVADTGAASERKQAAATVAATPKVAAAAVRATVTPASAPSAPRAPAAVFPSLQGAGPLPELLLAGLPHLMEGYRQGRLKPGAGVVPLDLVNCLLPAASRDNRSWSWVGVWTLVNCPLKPLPQQIHGADHWHLCPGSWAGLELGDAWRGRVQVMVPCGPQHLGSPPPQQQQLAPCSGLDMPGDWQEAACTKGTLSCYVGTRPKLMRMGLVSRPLMKQLEPLAPDHFLLGAQLAQGTLLLYCVPACFSRPDRCDMLRQRLGPQLRDLAAGVPLAQPLPGTTQPGRRPLVNTGVASWYPLPRLDGRVSRWGTHSLPVNLLRCLAPEGCNSIDVTVQVVAPAAAAAGGALPPSPVLPHGGQHEPHIQQHPPVAGATTRFIDSGGIDWVVMQQVDGFTAAKYQSQCGLSGRPAWRQLLGPLGDWYLYKAEAVRPRTIRLYLVPPEAVKLVGDSSSSVTSAAGAAMG